MALNDEYDDDLKCVDCGSYYCISKWFPGSCDAKQRDLFDTLKTGDRDVQGDPEKVGSRRTRRL